MAPSFSPSKAEHAGHVQVVLGPLAIHNGYYIWLKVHPDLLPLHGYERYEQLMSELIKEPGSGRTPGK